MNTFQPAPIKFGAFFDTHLDTHNCDYLCYFVLFFVTARNNTRKIKKPETLIKSRFFGLFFLEVPPGFEPGNNGFAEW